MIVSAMLLKDLPSLNEMIDVICEAVSAAGFHMYGRCSSNNDYHCDMFSIYLSKEPLEWPSEKYSLLTKHDVLIEFQTSLKTLG